MSSILPGVGGPLAIMRQISTALLAAFASSLGCTFAILREISGTAALFGFPPAIP
jgi:hypothetical protein